MSSLLDTQYVQELIKKASGLTVNGGAARLKKITERFLTDTIRLIEDFNVTPSEFWYAANYIARVGHSGEIGLVVAGLGLEHFLDLLQDKVEEEAGLDVTSGTPRTIEGPLYIEGAPLSKGEARLDQLTENGEVLIMEGQVKDVAGKPIAGAIVDVWHANTKGNYSHFDQSQPAFNLRRRIETDAEGRYKFRSILPSGYAVPPEGTTNQLLKSIGRHGNRPAHIHFFVTAPGYRKLTTQINIDGDEYIYDDFAYATRDGLIPPVARHSAASEIQAAGLNEPFVTIDFNFTLHREEAGLPVAEVDRLHAPA